LSSDLFIKIEIEIMCSPSLHITACPPRDTRDAFRARIRMLEAHFLVPMVMENRDLLQGEWKKLVCEDLILPCFKISKLEAIGRRLKRNYVFIFILIMIAWVTKIFLHAPMAMDGIPAFYRALRVGHIPSWLVAFVFVGTLASVIGIRISEKCTGAAASSSSVPAQRSRWMAELAATLVDDHTPITLAPSEV